MGSGGGSTQSSTGPPPYEVPGIGQYLSALMGQTLPGGKPAPSPLPNQQVAPFSPNQNQAFQGIQNQTGPNNSVLQGATGQQVATAAGAYADPNNPELKAYLDSQMSPIIQSYQSTIAPNISANAALTGTLGGSNEAQNFQLANYDLATALGNVGASTYETERNLQQNAAQNLPNMVSGSYIPNQELLAAGGQQQQQQQNTLNTNYQNQYQQAMWPYTDLQMLGQGLNAVNPGSTTISSAPGGK